MDLFAYSQIGRLQELLEINAISIPRLRGIRLMSEEECFSKDIIDKMILSQAAWTYEKACCSVPVWYPKGHMIESSDRSNKFRKRYLIEVEEQVKRDDGSTFTYPKVIAFRWELLHGKARKRLKYAIKGERKRIHNYCDTFNKYVGRSDVLCVHARIGGNNWTSYDGPKIERQPWFLEKTDDYFDSTYCNIYVKVGTTSRNKQEFDEERL